MAEISKPTRVQLSRAAGSRMPPNTVKVDRTTRWRNPFNTHADGAPMDQALAVQLFRRQMEAHGGFTAKVRGHEVATELAHIQQALGGKNLACWCRLGTPCHADVLLDLANRKGGG